MLGLEREVPWCRMGVERWEPFFVNCEFGVDGAQIYLHFRELRRNEKEFKMRKRVCFSHES